nr:enoyl-CoA hydratase/isomerase family protein [Frankia sp. ArI3]
MTVRHIGATGVVSIDNPPVNALHPDVAVEIEHAARAIEKDLDLRSMILIGTGRCFVAGGDIRYFTEIDREGAAAMALRVQRMQQALFDLRVPVIAAINGHALGGGLELLLSCDIAIAEEQARIGVTEVQLGLIPGAGGTQMLFSALPVGTAKRLLFTGDRLPAGEAHAIGLVDQVCPRGARWRPPWPSPSGSTGLDRSPWRPRSARPTTDCGTRSTKGIGARWRSSPPCSTPRTTVRASRPSWRVARRTTGDGE